MLTVENIFLTLGHKNVLRGLNLEFKDGKTYGLLGQNGAGKSTIGYLLMGLEKYRPEKGKIILDGEDITDLSIFERAQKGITLAWQEPARYEGVSIKDFLTLGNRYSAEEAREVMDLVGLPSELYFNRDLDESLSGGERKRIEMASVMLIKPRVVILDEPDSGIDFSSYKKVLDVAHRLREQGSIVILITHSIDILDELDYAYLICNGLAYREGEPDMVRKFYEKRQCDRCDFVEVGGGDFDY